MIDHEPYVGLMARVANTWHNRFQIVDRDDIKQEILLFWYSKQKQIREIIDEADDNKDRDKKIARRLHDVAHEYCRREKAQRTGYEPGDEFYYSRAMLGELIPAALAGDWEQTLERSGPPQRRTTLASEGNNHLAVMADVAKAWAVLSEFDRTVLSARFVEDRTVRDIAWASNTPESTVGSQIARALRRMADTLGGPRPARHEGGPGSRRAMSNAHAQALTSEQESGSGETPQA